MTPTENIPLYLIDPNPWQTRRTEDPAHVEEIARSIKAMGMMQTPSARKVGERYQLAFGHTRLAAYRLLNTLGQDGYDQFPLNLHELSDEQMAIAAFEENEKRRDLNPVEKAMAVQKMLNDFGWTQELIAEKLHIDRSGVSNMIRMLRLPERVLDCVASGTMPVRSAMALLPIYDFSDDDVMNLYSRFSFDLADFEALARNGEINSDAIRASVEKYTSYLHPEQLTLIEMPATAQENSGGIQTVVPSDVITATDEPFEPRTPITATQSTITDWNGQQETDGEHEFNSHYPEISNAGSENNNEPDVNSQANLPSILPVENKPASVNPVPQPVAKPVDVSLEPADPNEILFTITYKTNGVIAGVRKPGMVVPQLRMLSHLRPEEVPALMRDMGIG